MIKNVQRDTWVDYLRATITVLVVAHHSSLAYTTFAHSDKAAYINSTHPIVDNKRWIGLMASCKEIPVKLLVTIK